MIEFRVWWIPQVPMKPFLFDVPTLDAGIMLCDALAKYDLFQLEHRVKPDYSNAGGVEWRSEEHTGGQWEQFDHEDAEEIAYVRELIKT